MGKIPAIYDCDWNREAATDNPLLSLHIRECFMQNFHSMGAYMSQHALKVTDTKQKTLTSSGANGAAWKSRHFLFIDQRGVRCKVASWCEW